MDLDKISKEAAKQKRVFDLNLDSVDFNTPLGSEDVKAGRLHRDDISRISNAPAEISAFEKLKSEKEAKQVVRKDIPKL